MRRDEVAILDKVISQSQLWKLAKHLDDILPSHNDYLDITFVICINLFILDNYYLYSISINEQI